MPPACAQLQSLGLEDSERLDQMKRKNQKAVQVGSEEESLPFLHCMKQGLKDDVRNVKRLQVDEHTDIMWGGDF